MYTQKIEIIKDEQIVLPIDYLYLLWWLYNYYNE